MHEPLFGADDSSGTDFQSFVGFEQHAGSHLLMSCGFPGMDQVMQFLPLLWGKLDRIAFFTHAMSPSLSFALLLPMAAVAVVLVLLDNSLFNVTAFAKLNVVRIFLFRTDGQEGVEFF